MYLLQRDANGGLRLTKHDHDQKLPPYAILSHTWGADNEELTFQEVSSEAAKNKAGFAKVRFCGEQAKRDGLEYFWVDSCCIDKTHGSELSEAITSMFRWYQKATKCYVFLQDVPSRKRDSSGENSSSWETAFCSSRWFTRGWTLQEMIAPQSVQFFSRHQDLLGDKYSLEAEIQIATGIPRTAFQGARLAQFEPRERWRWVAKRQTRKLEDKAYCMLGIFGVYMPPNYGEGEYALHRLQKEVGSSWTLFQPVPTIASLSISSELDETASEQPASSSTRATIAAREREKRLQLRREQLLMSLGYEQMVFRRENIKDAQRKTCEWLLKHPTYISWNCRYMRPDQQCFLWINGKPGAGKSTIIKYAYVHAKRIRMDDEILVAFFFNARGTELEKSITGMYRAMLGQIIKAAPDLLNALDDVRDHALIGWSLDQLRSLFSTLVARLGSRHLRCFVDALDECEEDSVRDMVTFLHDLAEDSDHDEPKLYVCFASRHYPAISIRGRCKMVLEDETGHREDLEMYAHRRLELGEGESADNIRRQLLSKANGVFLWVVLVVGILNKEFAGGRIFAVQRRLQAIPAELSEVFTEILHKDKTNMDELLLSMQWVLYAERSLRVEEYYFAIITGLQFQSRHATDIGLCYSDNATADDMKRFVTSSSKGLVETAGSEPETVQFIYESVRDFLCKDGSLRGLWPEAGGQLASASSHDRLKYCCHKYLLASYQPLWFRRPSAEMPGKIELLRSWPFLEYAAKYVLHHANEAAANLEQQKFLGDFVISQWAYVANAMEPHSHRQHGETPPLLYICAQRNLGCLLTEINATDPWVHCPGETFQYAPLAAFAYGCQEALRVLAPDPQEPHLDGVLADPGYDRAGHCDWALRSLQRHYDPIVWAAETDNLALYEYWLERLVSLPC